MTDIFNKITCEVNVSMNDYFIEQKKKNKIISAVWTKTSIGGHQLYISNTGKSYKAIPSTPITFKVWTHPNGQRMLNTDGLSMVLAESQVGEYLHKASYENSRKIALMKKKIQAMNKRYDKLVQKAFNDGEPLTGFPNESVMEK